MTLSFRPLSALPVGDGRVGSMANWSKLRLMVNTAEVHVYLTEPRDGSVLATYSNCHLP